MRRGRSSSQAGPAMSVTTDSSDGVLRVLPVRLDGQDAADEEREPSVSVRDVQYTDEEVGRGVFALKRLAKSTLVEVAHCIWVPKAEYEDKVSKTVFEHYVFNCKKRGGAMLCLGLGSLFNHSDPPNLGERERERERESRRPVLTRDHDPLTPWSPASPRRLRLQDRRG